MVMPDKTAASYQNALMTDCLPAASQVIPERVFNISITRICLSCPEEHDFT